MSIYKDLNNDNLINYKMKDCKEKGCKMKIGKNVNSYIIYNVERYINDFHKGENTIDCLIICSMNDKKRVAMIELKSKSINLHNLNKKYENGYKIINIFIKDEKIVEYIIFPILLSKKFSTEKTKQLDKIKLYFNGKKYPIIKENCNCNLNYIFNKYDKFLL